MIKAPDLPKGVQRDPDAPSWWHGEEQAAVESQAVLGWLRKNPSGEAP